TATSPRWRSGTSSGCWRTRRSPMPATCWWASPRPASPPEGPRRPARCSFTWSSTHSPTSGHSLWRPGWFGKLYMFMEALNQQHAETRLTLMGLVALGLMNSVVSAFYYMRVLKAMYLREPGGSRRLGLAGRSIEIPIAIGALVAIFFGIFPGPLISVMQAAAVPMLTTSSGGFAATV